MQIVDFGHFQSENGKLGTLYFRNSDGQDWYDLRAGLTEWEPQTGAFVSAVYGAWAMVDRDGIVTNVECDPSRLMPGDRTVLGIDASVEEIEPGMLWDGETLLPPTNESMERVT